MDVNELGSIATSTAQINSASNNAAPIGQTTAGNQPIASTALSVANTAANPTLEQIKQAVQNINNSLGTNAQNVEFTVDSDSKKVVIRVVDQQTKEVIRQVPTEEVMEMSKVLGQKLGQVINQEA